MFKAHLLSTVPNNGSNMLYGLVTLQIIEIIPKVMNTIKEYMVKKLEKKVNDVSLSSIEKCTYKSSIVYHYYGDSDKNDDTVNSIIDYMCKQNSTKFLRFADVYKPRNKKPFSLNYKDLQCKILEEIYTEKGQLEKFTFELFSEEIELDTLQTFVNNIKNLYFLEKKNQLGNDRYFFREITMTPKTIFDPKTGLEEPDWSNVRRRLQFQMTKFTTNKSLNNIFGPQIKTLRKHVDLFMHQPEWYQKRGIPRTLGILLHGEPGTGKTSTIKAIAKDTNKHIFSVTLSKFTTCEQLQNLFFNETIEVMNDFQTVYYRIPLSQRLYVFEDIDCLTNIVQERGTANVPKPISKPPPPKDDDGMDDDDNFAFGSLMGSPINVNNNWKAESGVGITLAYLLNLLDGILETDQRLLIMTSNYPEKLDRALTRPGRVDLNIKFTKMTPESLKEMFYYFFELEEGQRVNYEFDSRFDQVLTPAEVVQILGQTYPDHELAFSKLIDAIQR